MARILCLILLVFGVLNNAPDLQAQTSTKPLAVGEVAPDFTLVEQNGKKVSLSDSKGKSPVVLVFYRGYW